jgi:uncharacterized membrane protein
MASKKLLFGFVMAFLFAVLTVANVSAFVNIVDVEVSGVDVLFRSTPLTVKPGEVVDVKVEFNVDVNAEDVRVKAWISGERDQQASSTRFDVLKDSTESGRLRLTIPEDIGDNDLEEIRDLVIVIENERFDEEVRIPLLVKRESYNVEILDVDMSREVSAGDLLALDVVVKNRGSQFADDTFVKARIDALDIEDRAYFGDLSSLDEPFSRNRFSVERDERLDKQDTAERRLFLRIPSNAPAGVYNVDIEAFNDDSFSTLTRKVVIVGASSNSVIVAPVHAKSFKVGETGEYSLTLVNSGNRVQVYELVVESGTGLAFDLSDPVVAVPAGSSKTVRLSTTAKESGKYDFAVNVHSGTNLVKREAFTAQVEGSSIGGSPTVLLTVVLAIIFIVLLIVLIVLLTRKPEKSEEFGESYY